MRMIFKGVTGRLQVCQLTIELHFLAIVTVCLSYIYMYSLWCCWWSCFVLVTMAQSVTCTSQCCTACCYNGFRFVQCCTAYRPNHNSFLSIRRDLPCEAITSAARPVEKISCAGVVRVALFSSAVETRRPRFSKKAQNFGSS